MISYILVIAVSVGLTLLVVNLLQKTKDGRLVIDEAKDSYYIAITTEPSILKKKRRINLTVHHIKTE